MPLGTRGPTRSSSESTNMRGSLVLLALLVVLALLGQRAEANAGHDSEELLEEVIDVEEQKDKGPQLSPEAFATIFEKLSTKCQKEIEANPQDPEKLSPRCGNELRQKVQRYLQREKEGPKEKKQEAPKKQQPKPKKKKQSRAQRESAAQAKKDEEFMQIVTAIGGFVATLIAVAVGAMCFINRKLKAEGMYFPDPTAKADACCG